MAASREDESVTSALIDSDPSSANGNGYFVTLLDKLLRYRVANTPVATGYEYNTGLGH
jgi:hypothetical protein